MTKNSCLRERRIFRKGYTDASIRTIAQNAGVSTSTIYTRYSDKEGLFRFLVEPAAKGLKELLRQSFSDFSSLTGHEQNEKFMEYSDRGFEAVIAYIYEYFSEFKLLITGAPGNYYQEFLEGLVQLDTDCTKKFLIQVGSKALAEGRVTDGFLHVVSSAFYSGIFEVVIHDMPMKEAKNYINELRTFLWEWLERILPKIGKKVQRKCKKQKNFVWTKADGYTVLFVNAERGQRYAQTLR